MLSQALQDAMNDQIRHEFTSAYAYLALSSVCEAKDLPGFAHWMRVQAQEEVEHAMKFYHFIIDRDGAVALQAIPAPSTEVATPLALFEAALAHEQRVTAQINAIYALAVQERDFASQSFLNWFVDEQVEEEKSAAAVIATLRRIGDDQPALVMLDRELGKRGAE
jgi:ferritin